MGIREIQSIIEAVLFAAGDPVELERLADIVDVDKRSLREILKKMMDSYNFERRGIHIIRMQDSYQMCTNGVYAEYIGRLAEPPRKQNLSNAALEVLSIVAYKQPVTRSTLEHIRGVNCDYIVNRLIERNFIEEKAGSKPREDRFCSVRHSILCVRSEYPSLTNFLSSILSDRPWKKRNRLKWRRLRRIAKPRWA